MRDWCRVCNRACDADEMITIVRSPICRDCAASCAHEVARTSDAAGRAAILGELVASCRIDDDTDAIVELTTAAARAAIAADDSKVLSALIPTLAAHDATRFAHALRAVFELLGEHAYPTQYFACRGITAALLVGDLEGAAAIRPADGSTSDDLATLRHLVAFMRAPAGSLEVREHLDQVLALRAEQGFPEPDGVVMRAELVEAYGQQRLGASAAALKRYAPYLREALHPWHLLAIGDALEATGKPEKAHEMWRRVDCAAYEGQWAELARERLARPRTPYR